MTRILDHPAHSSPRDEPRGNDAQQTRALRTARTRGLSDRQAVIAVMTTNGVTCQDIAFELLLPLRTVQGLLHQSLQILNLLHVEDLTYEIIAAHRSATLHAATGRTDQPVASELVSTDQASNSLVALDEAEASHPHQGSVARVAALTLELAASRVELEQQAGTVRQLQQAVKSRDTIGQAKGLLMERYKISADAAFTMLINESNRSNRKLVDVAHQLIYAGETPMSMSTVLTTPRTF